MSHPGEIQFRAVAISTCSVVGSPGFSIWRIAKYRAVDTTLTMKYAAVSEEVTLRPRQAHRVDLAHVELPCSGQWRIGTTGSEVMQRLAAPMVGGMITAPLLSIFALPAIYKLFGVKHLQCMPVRQEAILSDAHRLGWACGRCGAHATALRRR